MFHHNLPETCELSTANVLVMMMMLTLLNCEEEEDGGSNTVLAARLHICDCAIKRLPSVIECS